MSRYEETAPWDYLGEKLRPRALITQKLYHLKRPNLKSGSENGKVCLGFSEKQGLPKRGGGPQDVPLKKLAELEGEPRGEKAFSGGL